MLDALMAQWEFRFSPHSWVSWTGKAHRLVILSFWQSIWTQDCPCWSTARGLCAAAGRATRTDAPKASSAKAAALNIPAVVVFNIGAPFFCWFRKTPTALPVGQCSISQKSA